MIALAFVPLIVSMRTQFLRPTVNGLIARSAACCLLERFRYQGIHEGIEQVLSKRKSTLNTV